MSSAVRSDRNDFDDFLLPAPDISVSLFTSLSGKSLTESRMFWLQARKVTASGRSQFSFESGSVERLPNWAYHAGH